MKTSVNRRSKRPEAGAGANGSAAPDPKDLERIAVGLLARREHSRAELQHKLGARGFAAADIELLLDRLAVQRLQSDARFAASYTRLRSGRGYGPQRIRAELRARGVDTDLVETELATATVAADVPRVEDVWRRKFVGRLPQDKHERARQMRFLQQRGFSLADIHTLFRRLGAGND